MKKLFIILPLNILLFAGAIQAQDSLKNSVKKNITTGNENADYLQGKKIQQQQLTTGKFEKLDTAVSTKTVTKKKRSTKRKH